MTQESAMLDDLDKQLVRALQLDPRGAFSQIAAGLGVSEQTIARRYRRLRREGLLRVTGAVDPRALGQSDWLLRVQCRPDGAMQLGRGLARREDVAWVSISAGGSEVVFALRSRTREERDDLLVQRLPQSAPVLGVSASAILHRYVGGDASDWVGVRDSLTTEQVARLSATPRVPSAKLSGLDPGDDVLLDLLARDGRTSFAVLARTSRMSEGRVVRRVTALQASGVVYFDVDLASAALGFPTSAYLWFVVAPAYLEAAGAALASHDEVPFAAAVSGPANLVASVTCRDLDELYGYLTSKIAAIEGVRSLELSPLLRRIKQAGAMMDGDRLADPAPVRRRSAPSPT